MVSGSGFVRSGSGYGGVLSLSSVAHISDVAALAVNGVGHGLDAAVGKVHGVGTLGGVTVAGLGGVEGGLGVVVGYSVVVGVHRGLVRVSWGGVVNRGRGIGRTKRVISHGASKQGKGDKGLNKKVDYLLVIVCILHFFCY